MKKLIAILLMLVMSATALASCESTPAPTVKDITVNEDGSLTVTFTDGTTQKADVPQKVTGDDSSVTDAKFSFDADGNLVVTYPDGKTESLGKDAIKEYTVQFLDHDGTLLGEEKVLAGRGVKAPADPEREDYIFAGWDKSFASVTENLTVTATYTPMATYTVTFVDYDGKELAKETVVSGKGATAPADPTRTDYNFAGWDKDFSKVTGDMTVTATYTEKGTYVVTFMDYNGLFLGTAKVKEGKTATAPVEPSRDGYTFRGWSSSLSNITGNKTVTAQYTLVNAANVFDIAYKVSGNTVTLTLSLAGDVCVAAAQGTFTFEGMTATAVETNSALAITHLKPNGTVAFAYTSPTNVTKGEKLFTVTLTKTADTGFADLNVDKCADQGLNAVDYTVIGETIKLK